MKVDGSNYDMGQQSQKWKTPTGFMITPKFGETLFETRKVLELLKSSGFSLSLSLSLCQKKPNRSRQGTLGTFLVPSPEV